MNEVKSYTLLFTTVQQLDEELCVAITDMVYCVGFVGDGVEVVGFVAGVVVGVFCGVVAVGFCMDGVSFGTRLDSGGSCNFFASGAIDSLVFWKDISPIK